MALTEKGNISPKTENVIFSAKQSRAMSNYYNTIIVLSMKYVWGLVTVKRFGVRNSVECTNWYSLFQDFRSTTERDVLDRW
jgi:hypothetical protein